MKPFARGGAMVLARAEPQRFRGEPSMVRREDRIVVDDLRNDFGSTVGGEFGVESRRGSRSGRPVRRIP